MRRLFLFLLFTQLLVSSASPAAAQAPLEPQQLPARTTFYLIWRGSPTGEARKSNALLGLWDDPDFAPVRAAMVEALMNDSAKQKKSGPTREEIAEYATLLDNSFTFGYLPSREKTPAKAPAAVPEVKAPAWNGMFFVYDRSGKETLLSKAVLRMRTSGTEIPKLTEVTVAGVPALKIERKSGTTYWSETGKFAVSAGEESVFEEILKRVSGKSAGSSLAETEAYREAQPLLAGGIVEFFLRVPQLKELAGNSETAPPAVKALWSAIRLDAIHVFAGHISIDGARTRLQGAILGNTAEGSLFDIWGEGQTQPASLAYLTPDTIYYHESQFSLPGIYHALKRALSQSGSNTASLASTLENMAQTRIGMPLPDALALTTGEFGSLESSPALDPDKKLYFAGISNKPETLKLMRTILSDRITSERSDGNVTYLKISLKGNQGSTGVAQWGFYHLAVTPNLLLGATKSDTLRTTLSQAGAGDPALPKNLQAARAKFPERLNGFSYFDFQRLDWKAVKQQWISQATSKARETKDADAERVTKQISDWFQTLNPEVFPRHLHSLTGASWKDSAGVHFDEWVD
jgi:hypothetical protein